MSREGVHTRVATYVAVLGLLVSYLVPAFEQKWWPFLENVETVEGETTREQIPADNVDVDESDDEGDSRPTTPSPDASESERLSDFVVDYYAMMPNTAAGWEFIGPNLRLRGRDSYERFWSKFAGVEVREPPTVDGDHVTVRIVLSYHDGRTTVEEHVLGVVTCGDHLCIDSDKLS